MEKGAILSKIDVRDYLGVCCATTPLPDNFELELRRVKNQGNVGSCVAHALSTVIEYYNYTQVLQDAEMSVGYIYGNRNNSNHKGKGMIVRDAIASVCKDGDVFNNLFPYNIETPCIIDLFNRKKAELTEYGEPHRFTSYYKLTTVEDIKASLYEGNPVIMAMKWYKDIDVVNGVIVTKCEEFDGNHCMVIYGWNEQGWKVQNSWGDSWGNNGTATLPYEIPIKEVWGVTDECYEKVENINIIKPYSSFYGKIISKIINFILNLLRKDD